MQQNNNQPMISGKILENAKVPTHAIHAIEFSPEQIEIIKKTVAKDASDDELKMFMWVCQRTGLDPFMKQIYCITRKDKEQKKACIQTSIDGFRLIAERTGCYAPSEEPPLFCYKADGTLESATVYVYKKVDNEWKKCAGIAYWDEYAQSNSYGYNQFWKKMSRTMLAKCAEALVLRKAFPAELSGLYTHDEMAQADNSPIIVNNITNKLVSDKERVHITELWKKSGKPKEWMIAWLANYNAEKINDLNGTQADKLKADLHSIIRKNSLISQNDSLKTAEKIFVENPFSEEQIEAIQSGEEY